LFSHLDILGVFADVHCLVGVSQHVDLNHAVPIVLDLKVNVREQEELVLRLTSLGDDLLNLQQKHNKYILGMFSPHELVLGLTSLRDDLFKLQQRNTA
jgi:hypothetical protein